RSGNLMGALGEVVEESAEMGLVVELTSAGLDRDPPDEVLAAMIGAVREAVTNVYRHSGARSVVLHTRQRDGGVEVLVRDQGRGFDPSIQVGFGLASSIRGRIVDVGGRADIWSRPGRGTAVTLWAPT